MGCEFRFVGTNELKNIPYLELGFPVRSTSGEEQIANYNDRFFDKERTYFETVNNQEEYFRAHEKICFMVFLNNILMTSSHTEFNTPLDSISGQCFPFHAKITSFRYCLIWYC